MVTQNHLKEILHYDPETGVWTWIDAPNHNTRLNGQVAGSCRSDGYRKIRIDTHPYYAGRLAFLYMLGRWPYDEVDYIDRDPKNLKWNNLRDADSSQNKWNRVVQSASGYHGVHRCGNKWQVMVGSQYLGVYESLEEAIRVRDETAFSMAGPFAMLNNSEGITT